MATSLVSLSAAALLVLGGAGGAAAAPAASDDQKTPSVASATVDTAGAADYWTTERMRAAIPGDVLAGKALERGNSSSAASVKKGSNTKVTATKGKPTIAKDEKPVNHIGKVFFTMAGANYVCSGNAVTSGNKSTVSTAGHCVHEGLDVNKRPGAFATNFAFVPGYLNGATPYGKWTAKALYAPTEWSSKGDIQYDTGFAVMNQLNGEYLSDVVDASGVEFNAARGLTYKSYGYPAVPPFNGKSLKSCTGQASNDTNNPRFSTQGISCDMTGGSSGGPWFIGSGSDGDQNSVNSYGYSGSRIMYSPYWGSVIQQTYTIAAAS